MINRYVTMDGESMSVSVHTYPSIMIGVTTDYGLNMHTVCM